MASAGDTLAPSPEDGAGELVTEFSELRSLIIGPEQRELRDLEARITDPGRVARDVSAVLPEAILLRKQDPNLTRALTPTIEEAITSSVRQNPQPLADALFPVIGPARQREGRARHRVRRAALAHHRAGTA